MKKTTLSLFFLTLVFLVKSQNQDIDSLLQVVKDQSGTKKAEALYQLSLNYVSKNDSLALLYVDRAINEVGDNEKLLGRTIFHKGMVHRSLKHDVLAISNIKKSIELLKNIDSTSTADALYYLLRIHQRKGEFPEAIKTAYRLVDYRKALNNPGELMKSILELGYTYDRMGDYKEAIKWHRLGVKKALTHDNKYYTSWGTGLIGIAYDELKMYDSALHYNLKAVKIFKEIDNQRYLGIWYSNIANTYTKLKDYKNAEKYINASLEAYGDKAKSVVYINLAKIYLETKRYKEAQKTLSFALNMAKENDEKRFASEAFYRFHELRKSQNNYKDALQYYVKYKETEDVLLNEQKAKQITETKIEYDTAEKEKQILIQRANLAEQDLIIQQRNYQLYGLAGFALILGLLGYLFYNQQKLKNQQLQKENELKDALIKIETQNKLQEQRLRISRDLHDNIGAQLTFIISSIDNLKYGFDIKNVKLTKKLNTISGFASETIYELRDTIWAMNKDKISIEDLETRMANYIDKAQGVASNTIFEFHVDPLNADQAIEKQVVFSSVDGMNLYRIIQEAINNAIKYAKSNKIEVSISKEKDNLLVLIADDGEGFNTKEVEKGNGINNMKKRSLELNAEFLIKSKISEGTIIQLLIPTNT